jgi:hypothetical protein
MSWTQIFNAIDEQRAGGLAWLRYRLDMAGFEGSNPFRPIRKYRLLFLFWITIFDGNPTIGIDTV